MHASLVTPQKAAPKLTKMGAETVEWNPKAGDVQYVADEKALTIQRNNRSPATEDRGIRIGTHSNPKTDNGLVGNEGVRSGTMWSVAPVSATAKRRGVPLLVEEMAFINDQIRMGGRTMSSTD